MNKALNDLSHCSDIGSLETALRTLCSRYGPVSRLEVLPMVGAGKQQAVCLMRLESPEREQDLMTMLGASRVGENVYLVVDLRVSA